MAVLKVLLPLTLTLLLIDSAIELAFISATVAWLHARGGSFFLVDYDTRVIQLGGKPLNLLVDQGHTSNGAAGTAFVLVGLVGVLALTLRSFDVRGSKFLHYFWLVLGFLSMLLTLAALIYTFLVTYQHTGQTVDLARVDAAAVEGETLVYAVDAWTPENWLGALLKLPLERPSDRTDIVTHLKLAEGWRWNLIPMFILGLLLFILAVVDAIQGRWTFQHATYFLTKEERAFW